MNYPLLNAFLTMMWLFIWILWFFLLFKVIIDIFRSHDLGGWGKTGWLILVIILPFLGVFIYLIARGHKMSEHDEADITAQQEAFNAQVKAAAGTSDTADQLTKLADLHTRGVLTDEEYAAQKAKALAS